MKTGDYVKVISPDGDETELLINSGWMIDDPEAIAEEVAKADMDNACGELSDPNDWPRLYVVHLDNGPVKVSVDIEYEPHFYTEIEECREREVDNLQNCVLTATE